MEPLLGIIKDPRPNGEKLAAEELLALYPGLVVTRKETGELEILPDAKKPDVKLLLQPAFSGNGFPQPDDHLLLKLQVGKFTAADVGINTLSGELLQSNSPFVTPEQLVFVAIAGLDLYSSQLSKLMFGHEADAEVRVDMDGNDYKRMFDAGRRTVDRDTNMARIGELAQISLIYRTFTNFQGRAASAEGGS
jgi:hypothetical protein